MTIQKTAMPVRDRGFAVTASCLDTRDGVAGGLTCRLHHLTHRAFDNGIQYFRLAEITRVGQLSHGRATDVADAVPCQSACHAANSSGATTLTPSPGEQTKISGVFPIAVL